MTEESFGSTEEEILAVRRMKAAQLDICAKYGVEWCATSPVSLVAVSDNMETGPMPWFGMRLQPSEGAHGEFSGWLMHAGEWSSAADFYKPLHLHHLLFTCEPVLKFLGHAARTVLYHRRCL